MKVGRESYVRWRRVEAVGLGHRARQDFARGMHRHVTLSRGFRHGTLLQSIVTGHCHRPPITEYRHRVLPQDTVTGHRHRAQVTGYWHGVPSRGTATNLRHETTSQWHINKDTPDDFSSGVSEERQLPTLPPGLAVPSAMTGLASLFGMGRGGSPSL